jgi:hypothetical protein
MDSSIEDSCYPSKIWWLQNVVMGNLKSGEYPGDVKH